MQSIAEEVVSSSGGGGTYITSGFSNYVGQHVIAEYVCLTDAYTGKPFDSAPSVIVF